MLSPYINSVAPYYVSVAPLIVIIVPLQPPYCYYCALTLLLLGRLGLHCGPLGLHYGPMDSYI